jgi:hypothetical protein
VTRDVGTPTNVADSIVKVLLEASARDIRAASGSVFSRKKLASLVHPENFTRNLLLSVDDDKISWQFSNCKSSIGLFNLGMA